MQTEAPGKDYQLLTSVGVGQSRRGVPNLKFSHLKISGTGIQHLNLGRWPEAIRFSGTESPFES